MNNRIIKECVEKQSVGNEGVEQILNIVLNALKQKQDLNIEFLHFLHATLINTLVELECADSDEKRFDMPMKMRDDCHGSNPKSDRFTKDGITEIIKHIKKEKEMGFVGWTGTILAPIGKDSIPNYDKAIHYNNIDNQKLIDGIYKYAENNSLIILFPRSNNKRFLELSRSAQSKAIEKFLAQSLRDLIGDLNKSLGHNTTREDKITSIVSFVKAQQRLSPFTTYNHQISLGTLNFLLLKHEIGFCSLNIFNAQFIGSSLQESIELVNRNLIPYEKLSLEQREPLLIEILDDSEKVEKANKSPNKTGFFYRPEVSTVESEKTPAASKILKS